MAISKDKKNELVAELSDLLGNAKMTVFAKFAGVSVADMQVLRRAAREAGVKIKVVKNRLVIKAMESSDAYKDTDKTGLSGQLLYAISSDDEVAPAQVLDKFAKSNPALELVGGFSGIGANLDTTQIKDLAGLPSKDELIAQVVATLLSPLDSSINAIDSLGGILNALETRAS